MADVADTVPPAIDQTGNYVIWWVPATPGITDTSAPKAATELGAATTYRITHSFVPNGFAFDGDTAVNTDERLALTQVLESLGNTSRTLGTIEYVDSSAAGSAAVVLKPVAPAQSISGYFVVRRNVSNGTVAAAAQKVTTIPVTLGPQIQVPVDGTGKFRLKQRVTITGVPVDGTTAA